MIKEVKRMTRKENKVSFGDIEFYQVSLKRFARTLHNSMYEFNNYKFDMHGYGIKVRYDRIKDVFYVINDITTIKLKGSYAINLIEKYM